MDSATQKWTQITVTKTNEHVFQSMIQKNCFHQRVTHFMQDIGYFREWVSLVNEFKEKGVPLGD